MPFDANELECCRRLVQLALIEDLGDGGDVTSRATMASDGWGVANLVTRTPGVLAGIDAVSLVCDAVDVRLKVERRIEDGARLSRGDVVATLSGPVRSLLTAERTALNFVQRMSGVATLTRQYVDAIAGLPTKILDTRKTHPGWRALDKYSVRQGGGTNHRTGLYDMILIKDNHLAGLGIDDRGEQIREAVRRAKDFREQVDPGLSIEVEVDTLEQFDVALACGPEFILLDNMSPDQMAEAVRRRGELPVLLEASGGVTLDTVRAIAATGVDRISVGALTHSAPALDLALDYQT